jgi:hypothetical protein
MDTGQQPAGHVDLDLHKNIDFNHVKKTLHQKSVLWICIGFNADSDQHFLQCVSGSSILGNANPDLGN